MLANVVYSQRISQLQQFDIMSMTVCCTSSCVITEQLQGVTPPLCVAAVLCQ